MLDVSILDDESPTTECLTDLPNGFEPLTLMVPLSYATPTTLTSEQEIYPLKMKFREKGY